MQIIDGCYTKRKGLTIINCYDEKDEPTYGMTEIQKKKYYEDLWNKINKKIRDHNPYSSFILLSLFFESIKYFSYYFYN